MDVEWFLAAAGELAGSLAYPLALQLVTDEELGGRHGTRHQIEHGVRGEFVVIGETSGLRIVTESKGMLGVTLRASRISCASTARATGGSTGRPASRRWRSASGDTGSTGPGSTRTSPRSARTTGH